MLMPTEKPLGLVANTNTLAHGTARLVLRQAYVKPSKAQLHPRHGRHIYLMSCNQKARLHLIRPQWHSVWQVWCSWSSARLA